MKNKDYILTCFYNGEGNDDTHELNICSYNVVIPKQKHNVLEECKSNYMYQFIVDDGFSIYLKGDYIISVTEYNRKLV